MCLPHMSLIKKISPKILDRTVYLINVRIMHRMKEELVYSKHNFLTKVLFIHQLMHK